MNKTQALQPTLAVWELTLKCNLRCMHCGSSAGKPRPNELTTKEALSLCNDLADTGFQGVALMGGEIFLRSDWQTISAEIKKNDMKLSVITNGYFDPTNIIPQLQHINVDCVMVGLDGASPQTQDAIRGRKGSFEKALNFLHAAQLAGFHTSAITTVHAQNLQELPKIQNLIRKEHLHWQIQDAAPIGRFPKKLLLSQEQYYALGLFIKNIQHQHHTNTKIIGTHNLGFHSKTIPNLSPYPEWKGCYAGKTILGIQSNGNIKGCLALPDDYIEANIRNTTIQKLWNNPHSFSYNRSYTTKDLGSNCADCPHAPTCNGGCLTRSKTITGKEHNDPYCYYRIEQEQHP